MKNRDKTKDQLIAGDALLESEARFRSLMDHIPDVSIQGYRADGTVFYWNKASEEVYGYTVEEAIGQNLGELIVPPDLRPLFEKCLEIGKTVKVSGEFMPPGELMLLHKEGHLVPIYSIHTAVYIEGKEPLLFCIDVDLSERKRMEEALKESERKYRNLFETSPEAVFLEDMDGNVVSVNKKGCEIYGYSREEMLKLNVRDIVPPDISGNYPLLIDNLRKKKYLFFESRASRKRGESFPCDLGASLVKSGNRDYVQVIIRDITKRKRVGEELAKYRYHLEELVKERTAQLTKANEQLQREISERKRAEETLRYSEERYRQVVSTTTDAIMVFDAETRRFIEVNKACEELYGYSREEFLEITHTDITADTEKSDASIRRAVEGKLSRLPVRYHRKKDGAIFPVEISSSTFMHKGRLVICGVIRDITERKRAEEDLRQYQEKLEELVEERTEELKSEISERKKIEQELKKSESALQAQKEVLERKNIALREVLEQIEVEKREMKDAVAANAEELLLPLLRKLRSKVSSIEGKHLDVLESAVVELASSYGRKISEPRLKLTPREMEICTMIKSGLTSKEISELLYISLQTIERHRNNIRKKLGITKKKINLISYLQSL